VQVALQSADQESLIPRRSPLSHRLRYHAICLMSRFRYASARIFDCTPPLRSCHT
jgi:hypothetical protein